MAEEQYIELYKKYRPKRWGDLIGQEKVAQSFQSAIINNKLPTAYGLFGKHGCGKSSSAFLLAKAINCLNVGKDGNPCNECEVCENIDNGTQLGVNYVSMANKGSVEDVRELVQEARLNQPVKKQVWILDEVHNLHKKAFDALLIPIEDPSMPALFIFCSTEVDQIPKPIYSRIQARKINPVSPDVLLPYLQNINEKESLGCSDDDLKEAIRHGNGSVRDTLSVLETIAETGTVGSLLTGDIFESLSKKDLAEALYHVSQAVNNGFDGRDITERMFNDTKNLLLLVSGVDKSVAGVIPIKDIKSVAKGLMGRSGIVLVAEELADAINHMTLGADPQIHLEIALVKITSKLNKMQKMYDAKHS